LRAEKIFGVKIASMTHDEFRALLERMTRAICAGDGAAFYGKFTGRAEIARMVCNFFHRDARDLEWRLLDPLGGGDIGYARYDFSYVSRLPGCILKSVRRWSTV
jgi:hypothetical protein